MHEAWHAWENANVDIGGRAHLPGLTGECTVGGDEACDPFYAHPLATFHPFGRLHEANYSVTPGCVLPDRFCVIIPDTHKFHSPSQVAVEFNCDLMNSPAEWVTDDLLNVAAASQYEMRDYLTKTPPFDCGGADPDDEPHLIGWMGMPRRLLVVALPLVASFSTPLGTKPLSDRGPVAVRPPRNRRTWRASQLGDDPTQLVNRRDHGGRARIVADGHAHGHWIGGAGELRAAPGGEQQEPAAAQRVNRDAEARATSTAPCINEGAETRAVERASGNGP